DVVRFLAKAQDGKIRLTWANADERLDISEPKGCCEACVGNKDCIGWVFTEVCLHGVDRDLLPDICDYHTLNDTPLQNAPWEDSGVIRCSDGCGFLIQIIIMINQSIKLYRNGD
ncbi:10592_t:CDS:1, partial [Dentiscutata erythropus]